MIYERMDCRLCGAAVHTVLELQPTPLANLFPDEPLAGQFYPLGLKQCKTCGHVQIGHVVNDDEIYGKQYKYTTPLALKPLFELQTEALRKKYPTAKTVVEIGANNGLFLHALNKAGFPTVIGIDPSSSDPLVWKFPFDRKIAKLVVNRVGVVDLVIGINVFAHIDNLADIFLGIAEMLSEDGSLIFEVQYLMPMMAIGAFDMVYHEHRDYHTIAPLQLFLRKAGLIMTDWEIFDAHGGSLRITAKKHGLQKPAPVEKFDWYSFKSLIAKKREFLHEHIHGKIVAFGAPAKATTIIHHFGLQNKIWYCVDDTPAKQGTYIAGTTIPIVSRSVMAADNPHSVLLLSWNYADIIKKSIPHINFVVPFSKQYKLAA
jgi:hypothetical protein